MSITTRDKIQAIKRELGFRKKVYPNLVLAKKMTQTQADRQVAIFEEILKDYEDLQQRENKQMKLF